MDKNQKLIHKILEGDQRESFRRNEYDNKREVLIESIKWNPPAPPPEPKRFVFVRRGNLLVMGHHVISPTWGGSWITGDGYHIEQVDGWYPITMPTTRKEFLLLKDYIPKEAQ